MQFLKIKGLDEQLGGDEKFDNLHQPKTQWARALAATKTDAQTYAGTVPAGHRRQASGRQQAGARRPPHQPARPVSGGMKLGLGILGLFVLGAGLTVLAVRAADAGDRRIAPHDTPPPVDPEPAPRPALVAVNPALRWDREIIAAAFQALMSRHWPAPTEPSR